MGEDTKSALNGCTVALTKAHSHHQLSPTGDIFDHLSGTEERKFLWYLFHMLDSNRDGKVSHGELLAGFADEIIRAGFIHAFPSRTAAEIMCILDKNHDDARIMHTLDENRDKNISFDEFLGIMPFGVGSYTDACDEWC